MKVLIVENRETISHRIFWCVFYLICTWVCGAVGFFFQLKKLFWIPTHFFADMRTGDRRKAVGGIKIETGFFFCLFFKKHLKIPASIGCRDFACIMNRHSFQLAQPHPPGKSEGGFPAQPCVPQNKKYDCCSIASQTAQGNSKCCVRNFGQRFSIKNWKWALRERDRERGK